MTAGRETACRRVERRTYGPTDTQTDRQPERWAGLGEASQKMLGLGGDFSQQTGLEAQTISHKTASGSFRV